ncbi:hypothetical protein WOLCODRAFT_97002 [Wolfiporia cocos MD-104 SS10]|uniref:Non-ribosomal peptide synthetase n=1 Tax=Wolfiporia cocos (strain MD-104) TaxID=742152 RepID=A0A2H3J9T7_WOLCO|nr:hypothetical protein WOLCODRAFT_97002 [Wolfiporia cocos MD-104 SS10]
MAVAEAIPEYVEAVKGVVDVTVRPTEFPFDEEKDVAKLSKIPVLLKDKESPQAPAKPARRKPSKWILWTLWFNTYRKLFTVTFTVNMIMFGFAVSGHWHYAIKYGGAMAVGNFNVAILVRNEIFGRLLYLFVNTCFAKWTPLKWRLMCTSILQHLGGIHSGCAISGIIWLTLRVVDVFRTHATQNKAIMAFGICTNVAMVITAVAGFPWVRNTHHNVFERWHRFMGWTGLLCSWIFILMGDLYDTETRQWNLSGVHIVKQQDFWYIMGMTAWIALPWICTRRVAVDIELPSSKVAVLRFQRGMQQGVLGRISRSAVKEYHAFGTISEGRHAKYHYMVCGVQGDFTRSLVDDPPKYMWTREVKFAGVSNTSTLYKRGIRICTGTGIGAALSTCIQSPNWYVYLLTQNVGSDQEKTFGSTISSLISRNIGPERYLLWDSKVRGGRPDTRKLLADTYRSWNAEVVFITSNYTGNSEMMQACKEEGIPCFGTLWDFVSNGSASMLIGTDYVSTVILAFNTATTPILELNE